MKPIKKRGAPEGNQNALKRGKYVVPPLLQGDLPELAEQLEELRGIAARLLHFSRTVEDVDEISKLLAVLSISLLRIANTALLLKKIGNGTDLDLSEAISAVLTNIECTDDNPRDRFE